MLTLLGLVSHTAPAAAPAVGLGLAGALKFLIAALSLGALGINVLPPTRYKNSGILRFTFRTANSGPPVIPGGTFNNLSAGGLQIVQCLGAGGDTLSPDDDTQVFGGSPGHGIVTGVGLFTSSDLVEQPTQVLAANPVDPTTGLTHVQPTAYIPSGTKVHAYFILAGPTGVGSPTANSVIVQTEVAESRIRRGANGTGNNSADPDGRAYIGSIRVAVLNNGAAIVTGMLVVELQHSEHDIPGVPDQSMSAVIIPPT